MKRKDNHHILFFLMLLLVGFFIYLPIHAQSQTNRLKNQNLDYWAMQDYATKQEFAHKKVPINYTFHSKVICDSSFNSVRDCHIINLSRHTGTMADAYGEFRISADVNDSISFSALGYEKRMITLTDSMFTYGYIIKLKPTVYELEEVTITPFRIELPEISKFGIYTPPLPNQGGINLLPGEMSPVSALYNRFSKEAKQKKYYKKLIEGTADFMVAGEKFNGAMVAQLTGLKDDQLIEFMSYCAFTKDFILNYSPETIKRAIRIKYKKFIE